MKNKRDLRCLYVVNFVMDSAAGYDRKIQGQASAFRENGINTDVLLLPNIRRIVLQGGADGAERPVGRIRIPALYRFSLLSASCHILSENHYDIVYFRYPRADMVYFLLLLWIRLRVRGTLVYSEMPTYPYDSEDRGFISLGTTFWRLQDRIFRHLCKYLIHCFVAVSHDGTVFGRPAIRIENGVDVESTQIRSVRAHGGRLRGIAVAHAKPWHGYDRVLRGMAAYRDAGHEPPEFVLVSSWNAEVAKLSELARKLDLQGLVFFAGQKKGAELDLAYGECDFAYGALAPHRIRAYCLSSLKVRECLARGLPVVNAGTDPIDKGARAFVLKVDSCELPLDVSAITAWAKGLAGDHEVAGEMRSLALRCFSWSATMKDVIKDMKARCAQNQQHVEGI